MTKPDSTSTKMAVEAAESAAAIQRQIERCGPLFSVLGTKLRELNPSLVVTCARGSSDHAATYGKYLIETHLGLPVASVGPSVVSLYNTDLKVQGALFVAVSQSGRSPDLLRLAAAAKKGGAYVVALVNDETSPLAEAADLFIPLCAGPEISVAATKSYLTACAAFLSIVAEWKNDDGLRRTAAQAPTALSAAAELDWTPALLSLTDKTGLYIIGRGVGTGAIMEMALKCKETCRLHAEAFSAAEVIHGPLALVGPDFPVLAINQNDATADATRAAIARCVELGAPVFSSDDSVEGVIPLPSVPALAPELAPLAAVQSFYMAIHTVSQRRGLNPDVPANLRKVTETV